MDDDKIIRRAMELADARGEGDTDVAMREAMLHAMREATEGGNPDAFGKLSGLAKKRKSELSNTPNPNDLRQDLSGLERAAAGLASFGTNLGESGVAAGGHLWRTGAQRAADAITDTEIGGDLAELFRRGVNATPGGREAIKNIDEFIPETEEIEQGRMTADQYRKENFFSGRVAGAAGGFAGLMGNLALLGKVPGLRGAGVPAGATRFAAEQAIVPEIQAEASGTQSRDPHLVPVPKDTVFPERVERMAGRAIEGASLDLLLRGVGGASQKAFGAAGVPGRLARGGGQAAALGALGAAQAPEGERLEEAGAMALLGAGMGLAGGRFPARQPKEATQRAPLGSRPLNEARRPTDAKPEGKSGVPAVRSGDPMFDAMVKGDRPAYLIPGEGNKALKTPSERRMSLPPPAMLLEQGIQPVAVPGLGKLLVNTNHPLYAGKDVPEFVRVMQSEGRTHELMGYSSPEEGATHIVTALDAKGEEVASVRTKTPLKEASNLEGMDGVEETVVRSNTSEATQEITTKRLSSLVEDAGSEARQFTLDAEQSPEATQRAPLEIPDTTPSQESTPDGITPEGLRQRADLAERDGIHASARDLRKMADEMEAAQGGALGASKDEFLDGFQRRPNAKLSEPEIESLQRLDIEGEHRASALLAGHYDEVDNFRQANHYRGRQESLKEAASEEHREMLAKDSSAPSESDIADIVDGLVKDGRGRSDGSVRIHDIRDAVRERLGEAAASHERLDPVLKGMWASGSGELVTLSDGREYTRKQQEDGIPGVREKFGEFRTTKKEPAQKKPSGITPEALRERDGIHASARDLRKMADEMEAKQGGTKPAEAEIYDPDGGRGDTHIPAKSYLERLREHPYLRHMVSEEAWRKSPSRTKESIQDDWTGLGPDVEAMIYDMSTDHIQSPLRDMFGKFSGSPDEMSVAGAFLSATKKTGLDVKYRDQREALESGRLPEDSDWVEEWYPHEQFSFSDSLRKEIESGVHDLSSHAKRSLLRFVDGVVGETKTSEPLDTTSRTVSSADDRPQNILPQKADAKTGNDLALEKHLPGSKVLDRPPKTRYERMIHGIGSALGVPVKFFKTSNPSHPGGVTVRGDVYLLDTEGLGPGKRRSDETHADILGGQSSRIGTALHEITHALEHSDPDKFAALYFDTAIRSGIEKHIPSGKPQYKNFSSKKMWSEGLAYLIQAISESSGGVRALVYGDMSKMSKANPLFEAASRIVAISSDARASSPKDNAKPSASRRGDSLDSETTGEPFGRVQIDELKSLGSKVRRTTFGYRVTSKQGEVANIHMGEDGMIARVEPGKPLPKKKRAKRRPSAGRESGMLDFDAVVDGLNKGIDLIGDAIMDARSFEKKIDKAWSRVGEVVGEAVQARSPQWRKRLGFESPFKEVKELGEVYKAKEAERIKLEDDLLELHRDVGESGMKGVHVEFFDKGSNIPDTMQGADKLRDFQKRYRDLVERVAEQFIESGVGKRETYAKFQDYGRQGYSRRIPGSKDARKRAKNIIKKMWKQALGGDPELSSRPQSSRYEQGVGSLGKGVKKNVQDINRKRESLSPEQAFSDRVYMKDGKVLTGKVVRKRKDGAVRFWPNGDRSQARWIPKSQYKKTGGAYQQGTHVLHDTIRRQGKAHSAFSVFEKMAKDPKFKDFWREPVDGSTDPNWIKLPNDPQSYGMMAGKEIHKSIYHDVKFFARPIEGGALEILKEMNFTVKMASVVGRLGYPTKMLFGEWGLMNLPGLGVPLERIPRLYAESWRDLNQYLKDGTKTPEMRALMNDVDLFHGSHMKEVASDGGRGVRVHDRVKGRGPKYIAELFKDTGEVFADKLTKLDSDISAGRVSPSGFRVMAAFSAAVRSLVWGADAARVLGAKEGHRHLRMSGEAIKDAVQLIDAVGRLTAYKNFVRHGVEGSIRRGIRRAVKGKGKVDNPYTHEEAVLEIERVTNPDVALPKLVNDVGQFTFVRFPTMLHISNLLRARAVTRPLGFAMSIALATIMYQLSKEAAERLGFGWDEEETQKQIKRSTYGDERRGRMIVPIKTSKDAEPILVDQGSIQIGTAGSVPEFLLGPMSSMDVADKPGEGAAMKGFRTASNAIPLLGKAWSALGYSPRTGRKFSDTGSDRGAVEAASDAASSFAPFAGDVAQFLRSKRMQKEHEESPGLGVSRMDDRTRLLNLFARMPSEVGLNSDSRYGKSRDRSMDRKASDLEFFGIEGSKSLEVKRLPRKEDYESEADFRRAMKIYKREKLIQSLLSR